MEHVLSVDVSQQQATQEHEICITGLDLTNEEHGSESPAAQAAAARLLFGMAREGRLPRALARIDQARGVPLVALLTASTLTLIVAVWAARRNDGLDVLVSIVDVGALAAFALLHASIVGYFVWQRRGEARAVHLVIPTLGAIVTLGVIMESSALAKTVAAVWLLVGLVASGVTRRESPRLSVSL